MPVRLAKGTKEYIPVDVTDRTGAITNLASLTPTYDFLNDAGTAIYSAASAVASSMRLSCLIDASSGGPSGLLPNGHYRLFVSFTSAPTIPRLGPIDVYISDT
jgi:hypothetical protein